MVAVLADKPRSMITSAPGADLRRAAAVARGRRPVDPAVYRRRRLLVGGLLLLLVAAVLIVAQSVWAGTGGGPLAATGAAASSPAPATSSAPAMSPAGAAVWVVRPGDTLWSIARSVQPHGDERGLVDRLDAELHGATLYPGEVVPLPVR